MAARAKGRGSLFSPVTDLSNLERDQGRRDYGDDRSNKGACVDDVDRQIFWDSPRREDVQTEKERDLDNPVTVIKGSSIYVGQWDALKEKMVWGTMGKEKVIPFKASFMSGATSSALHDVDCSSTNTLTPQQKQRREEGGKNMQLHVQGMGSAHKQIGREMNIIFQEETK